MDPQTYIECDTNLEVAAVEEWIGREYARSLSSVYPVPPETWIGPPTEPPPEAFTFFYVRATPKAANGGVLVMYDAVLAFATQAQQLSTGQSFSYDLVNNQKTYEQLSEAAKTALPPPE
jgi:hypothetical protein